MILSPHLSAHLLPRGISGGGLSSSLATAAPHTVPAVNPGLRLPVGPAPAASVAGGLSVAVAAMAEARRQPVAAHGWWWRSQSECARQCGVGHASVSEWLRDGTFEANVLKRLGAKP